MFSKWFPLLLLVAACTDPAGGDSPKHEVPPWTGENADDTKDPTQGAFSPSYSLPGVVSTLGARVNTMVRGPDGALYVGGIIEFASGVPAKNVARFGGSDWDALGGGLPDSVNALVFDDNGVLYAGGDFQWAADGDGSNYLARFDGTAWELVSGAMDGGIQALAPMPGGGVYVGGGFSHVGDLITAGLATFDGTDWGLAGLGAGGAESDGFAGMVKAIVPTDDGLCIGGGFTTIDDVPAMNVACFDGVAWTQLADGLNSEVMALTQDAAGVWHAGGYFGFTIDYDMGVFENCIGRVNPETHVWEAVGGGVRDGFINSVRDIVFADDGTMYIAGTFDTAGSGGGAVPAVNIASFKDGNWSELDYGVVSNVGLTIGSELGGRDLLLEEDGSLLVGGIFSDAGGDVAMNIARYDDGDYEPFVGSGKLFQGVNGWLDHVVAAPDGSIYVAGQFTTLGDVAADNVGVYTASGPQPLGFGLNDVVRALVIAGSGDVYATGDFTASAFAEMSGVARWDGEVWNPLGDGLFGTGAALAEAPNGDIVVGGDFLHVGGTSVAASGIARWDGASWHNYGAGLGDGWPEGVLAVAFDADGTLYAGGLFDNSGDATVRGLARWTGERWVAVGGGLDEGDTVSAITFWRDGMYVGGHFLNLGGREMNRIARWDGASWHDLDSGLRSIYGDFTGSVQSMAVKGNGLFAVGNFERAGSTDLETNFVAFWDGEGWHALGNGVSDVVESVTISEHSAYFGGTFSTASGISSIGIARLRYADAD